MTAEELELSFENAPTIDAKSDILNSAIIKQIDNFGTLSSDEFAKLDESIKNLFDELKILKIEKAQEENEFCNAEIESGNLDLYRCINSVDDCVFGETYYVKIDDVAADYRSRGFDKISKELEDYINKIEPTITIFCDKGIGTLKFRRIFSKSPGTFNEYFIKD
jgi:hypothetical protein